MPERSTRSTHSTRSPSRPPSGRPPGAPPREAAAAPEGGPRYQQVAQALIAAIAEGRYPVGAQLPTEHALCELFSISRFTAREAVRVLLNAGMVVRRQRAGTIVVSTAPDTRFTHTASSLGDLGQYARDTTLAFHRVGHLTIDRACARDLGLPPGESWTTGLAVRRDVAKHLPICVTRVYLSPLLPGIGKRLRTLRRAVYTLIVDDYGMPIERVVQELRGALLDAEDAKLLDCRAGSPALRIIRHYYSGAGRLLEVSDSVHPADRYSYRMELLK